MVKIPPDPYRIIKRRHRTPSVKQIRAIQLINQGYSKRRAMLEAGYSKHSANVHSHLVTKSRAMVEIVDSLKNSLRSSKLTGEYMAQKFERWLEAQKDDPDDYRTQLEAAKLYKEIMKPEEGESKIKRKITFEEFVGGEEKEEPKNETKL